MGWLIALFALVLLAILPLGVSGKYDIQGSLLHVSAGPIKIRLYPKKHKGEKPKKAKETKKKAADSKEQKTQGGSLKDFLPLANIALDFLGDLKRKLRITRLDMKLTLAGDDPCDLGINYGRAWAALGNLIPRLEEMFVIKKRNMEVACDFTADAAMIYARADLSIPLGTLLVLVVRYGVRALKAYQNLVNERKGGAK